MYLIKLIIDFTDSVAGLIFLTPVPANETQRFHTKYYALHASDAPF